MPPKAAKAKPSQAKHKSGGGNALDNVLIALAKFRAAGRLNPSRKQVGCLAGVDAKSSTMRSVATKFKREGLVDTSDPKTFTLTPKGIKKVGSNVTPITTNAEFQDPIKKLIKNKNAVQIFEILASGEPRTKAELGKMIGVDIKKSTFRAGMTPLNNLELLEEVDGKLQLVDFCFPFGRSAQSGSTAAHSGTGFDSSDDSGYDQQCEYVEL